MAIRYRLVVHIQIAVRLPAQLVNSLDELVAAGACQSRTSVIERALLREFRHQHMLQEVEILSSDIGTEGDLDSLVWMGRNVTLDFE
jgi:Arc/MetJ-type ribon-helix-helix transcriptional regulator